MEITKLELLNEIPNNLVEVKKLIEDSNGYYEINNKGFLIIDEVDFLDKQYMIQIDKSDNDVVFIDDLVDLEKVLNIYGEDIDTKNWKKRYNELKKDIQKIGFEFENAGAGGNEDYLWYELSIKADLFTKDKLEKATKLWADYNEKSRALLK